MTLTPKDFDGVPVLGKKDAPIILIEFGDFLCPACKKFDQTELPQLKEKYIATGKAKLFYINLLYHGEASKKAAVAAENVWQEEPESYWSFHTALFASQPKEEGDWVTPSLLTNLAQQTTRISPQLITVETYLTHVLDQDQLGQRLQVHMTPTLLINGKAVNALDLNSIESNMDQILNTQKQIKNR